MEKHEKIFLNYINENRDKVKRSHNSLGEYYDFIFLCGKERKPGDNREVISEIVDMKKNRSSLYSEELITFLQSLDLLRFEEILLEISTAVIIIVESWGSACELGAFTHIDTNLNKIYVINDKKYQNSQSFINEGPIRKIKTMIKGQTRVFEEDFRKVGSENVLIVSPLLHKHINEIQTKKTIKQSYSITNRTMSVSDVSFLLWLIFDMVKIMGVVCKKNIYEIIKGIYNIDNIKIVNQSLNINSQDIICDVINLLGTVLLKFKLISEDDDKYKINYEYLKSQLVRPYEFSSIIFIEGFSRTKKYNLMRSKIIGQAQKEGFKIWI